MKTCRKSVATTVLLSLIYLLTLRIDDAIAERKNDTSIKINPKIILEEVIITGSGNNTRVIADAVAEDASTIGNQILSLLSKREMQRNGRSKQTLSNSDQDTAQSRTVIADTNDENDLERLKRVIAKYEPQRIVSRKTKRKILNGAPDILYSKAAGSTTDLERAYDEVLRNISQRTPELTSSNVYATLNPYLSQTRKNLRENYIPKAMILSANDEKAQKSRFDVDSSYKSPILRDKKTKKSLKKYLQLNHTVTTLQDSPIEKSRLNEETANKSSASERYFKIFNEKTKPKNELLFIESSSNIYSESTDEPDSHQDSLVTVSPIIPQLNKNNSYNVFNVNNLNNLNLSRNTNMVQLLSRYNRMPRPFSVLQSPDSSVIEIPYRKPNPSLASFNRQQVAPSSANVLPLILPTETLFDTSSARRYVPINRVNHLKPERNSTTLIVNTEASPSTSPVDKTFADYSVPYTNIIGTTKSPLITVNNQQKISSLNYYAITENPTEQIATKTDSAKSIHIPSQTSTLYTLQQEKDPQTVDTNGFLPGITAYNSPNDEKTNLNANAELALYNKFASLYSVPNIFNVPKAVTQNYQNFGQLPVQSLHAVTAQHISTPSYATLKPISPSLLEIRPIASTKPALAPYYDSGLFVSPKIEEKELNDNKKNEENVKINESRIANVDESNTETADDKNNFANHKVQINHGFYKNQKMPNKQREKEVGEEENREDRYQQPKRNHQGKYHEYEKQNKTQIDHRVYKIRKTPDEKHKNREEEDRKDYQQPKHNYGYYNKYHEYEKDNNDKNDDKNNDKHEKYNVRHKDNKDEEEDVDETQEDEYIDTEKNQNERNHGRNYQYNKNKYDKDNSEEEENDKQRYDHKKYDKKKNPHDEHDRKTDVKHKFVSTNKYFDDPRYSNYEVREPDEKYRKNYDQKKTHDKKDVDESFAEDNLSARHSKDKLAREDYEKKQKDKDDKTQKRKNYRHRQATPQRDSYHEEHKHEESDETNPKHVREEYHHIRQHIKDDDRRHNSKNDKERTRDPVHGETQEHEHKHHEEHHKKKDGGDHKFEKGESAEHKDEHHKHEGEKGHKGYKVWDEHEKAEKGYHDKEHASKEYDEKDGEEKKHEEESGFHKEKHHGEAGQKAAEFSEKGEHKKGHSTHGEHSVHKKDEYEKKTEFFDEFHEDGDMEKHGEHHHEHESKKGGHYKKGHHDAGDHEDKYGKEEKHEEGGHHHEHKGHKIEEGHDHHYDHDEKYGKKEGHEHGKKWSFKKGDGDAGDGHNR